MGRSELLCCVCLCCVCVCGCVTVNTTLWWKKESGQILTHSTHLLDVLQAEVAPANKWIFPVTDTIVFLLQTIRGGFTIFHNYMTPQIRSSPLSLWSHSRSKPYCSLRKIKRIKFSTVFFFSHQTTCS